MAISVVLLLLALIEADVLENEDLTRLESLDGGRSLVTVGIGDEGHIQAGELGKLAHGSRENCGSEALPLGRPRWLMRMTRALCSTR